jgi:hypothetical protein
MTSKFKLSTLINIENFVIKSLNENQITLLMPTIPFLTIFKANGKIESSDFLLSKETNGDIPALVITHTFNEPDIATIITHSIPCKVLRDTIPSPLMSILHLAVFLPSVTILKPLIDRFKNLCNRVEINSTKTSLSFITASDHVKLKATFNDISIPETSDERTVVMRESASCTIDVRLFSKLLNGIVRASDIVLCMHGYSGVVIHVYQQELGHDASTYYIPGMVEA